MYLLKDHNRIIFPWAWKDLGPALDSPALPYGILGAGIVYTFIDGWWEEGQYSIYSGDPSAGMRGVGETSRKSPCIASLCYRFRTVGKNKFKTRTGRGKPTTRVVRVARPIGWTPRPGARAR